MNGVEEEEDVMRESGEREQENEPGGTLVVYIVKAAQGEASHHDVIVTDRRINAYSQSSPGHYIRTSASRSFLRTTFIYLTLS